MILQIDIFDFDFTLFDTPLQEDWEKHFNKNWVNDYFYNNPKSLLPPLVIKPIDDIVEKFYLSSMNPFVHTVVMTGRIEPLRKQVEAILEQHNLFPDELLLCPPELNSIDFKLGKVRQFIKTFPGLKKIKFYDDRTNHLADFKKLCKDLNVPCETFAVFNERQK